jgi:ComF family protein
LFVQCRSAVAYQEGSRPLILKFKQGDGTYLAPGLANLMLRAGQDILSHTDLLIPVPLHWKRLFMRQYNQATLLSSQLSRLTKIPTCTNILKRHRSTPKQGRQSRKERYANVRGAFTIPLGMESFLEGKRLTLIDDVYTTGATLTECARILLNGGAKEVRVLTLARVITSL